MNPKTTKIAKKLKKRRVTHFLLGKCLISVVKFCLSLEWFRKSRTFSSSRAYLIRRENNECPKKNRQIDFVIWGEIVRIAFQSQGHFSRELWMGLNVSILGLHSENVVRTFD